MADTVGDIVACDIEDATLLQDTADDDVGMGMAGVVMIDRNPVEARLQILLRLSHQVTCKTLQIGHLIGILGRNNEAELMPILAAPFDKGLAVSLILKRRIGLPFLAIPVDSIPFEVTKVRIDRFGRRPGLCRTTEPPLPSWGIELHDPGLDCDSTRAESAARVLLPTTITLCLKKRRDELGTTTASIEPTASVALASANRIRSAPDPMGISSGPPDGHLDLLEERLGLQASAGIDPGPPVAHAPRTYVKFVALIRRHEADDLHQIRAAQEYYMLVVERRSNA